MNLAGNPMNAKECGEATASKSEPSWPICCRKTTTEAGNNGSQRLSFSLFALQNCTDIYSINYTHTHLDEDAAAPIRLSLFLTEPCVTSSNVL